VTEICPAKAGSAHSILENMRESNITDIACRERMIFGYICAKNYSNLSNNVKAAVKNVSIFALVV